MSTLNEVIRDTDNDTGRLRLAGLDSVNRLTG